MTTPFPFTLGQTLTSAQLNAITTLPINDQTASYVALVGDVGKRIVMNVGTANTVTINNSVFATGDTIFVANKGAGASTLTAGAGVTINSASGLVLVQHQSGQLVALSASSFLFVLSSAGSGVVQVKSVTKTDTFTTSSTSFVDITGLTLSMTPTSASNKILVFFSVIASGLAGTNMGGINIVRDSTAISQADAAGTRTRATSIVPETAAATSGLTSNSFLDSPATTAATTYKLQIRTGGPGTLVVNRTSTDTDNLAFFRGTSSLTIMEVTP